MKKIIVYIAGILFLITGMFAQNHTSVELGNQVYELLRYAELKGYVSNLSLQKPYTKNYILNKLDEITEYLEDNSPENEYEISLFKNCAEGFIEKDGIDLKRLQYKSSNNNEDYPFSFYVSGDVEGNVSGGLYDEANSNSNAYELFFGLTASGDLGKNISFETKGIAGLTKAPLEYMGDYEIGPWLYENFKDPDAEHPEGPDVRKVKVFKNNSYLPYSYVKAWDGSCYFLSNVTASGLEGWAIVDSFAFGMFGEIKASFFDNRFQLSVGRQFREWAAMDDGSSLVLNSHARPFFAFESKLAPTKWLSISSLGGNLEFPNREDILADAFFFFDEYGRNINSNHADDDFFFQNSFAMTEVDFDFKYFHFDFGSTAVYPKRFEPAYMFPLLDRVISQNNYGDFDNLALFGDFKFIYPGLGQIWLSGYLDEVNAMKTRFWENTRAMYSLQLGTKFIVPVVPLTTVSFRYTKVEPYCYTHHGINYTPYFNHYISESYTNNGECLGYYLPPNSDEFHLKVESRAIEDATFRLQYQLIRHGVDWGSADWGDGGNNLYSELHNVNRSGLRKSFLKDGVYEWSNIISLYAGYDFRKVKLPLKMYANVGYIYDWFTDTTATDLNDIDNMKNASFHYINTDEYNDKHGFVATLGFTIFN